MTMYRDDVLRDDATFASHDKLGRSAFADGLTNLVTRLKGPTVFALDGDWGTGKTYFLSLWANTLRADGKKVVYFNAFQEDYSGDAFLALTSKTLLLLNDRPARKKKFVDTSVRLAKIIGRTTFNVGLKAATAGFIDSTGATGAVEAAINQLDDETDRVLRDIFSQRERQGEALTAFRNALRDAAHVPGEGSSTSYPVIFIIDELDRCRPDFALAILEVAKHIFEIEGFHFILGVNIRALGSAVKSLYGSEIDGAWYLRRFVDYSLTFPTLESTENQRLFDSYCTTLVREAEGFAHHQDIVEPTKSILISLARSKRYSLRDIRRIISVMSISLIFVGNTSLKLPTVLVVLAAMKVCEPGLFAAAREKRLTVEDLRRYLNPTGVDDDRAIQWTIEWWEALLSRGRTPDQEELLRVLGRYNLFDYDDVIPHIASKVIDRFTV